MRFPVGARLVTLTLALTACTTLEDVPDGVKVMCNSPSDCPAGQVCHLQRCALTSQVDLTPPELSAAPVVEPRRVKAGTTFTVTFAVSEPLDGSPAVSLGLSEVADLDCTKAALVCTCTYQPRGTENQGVGGEIAIAIAMVDAAGNSKTLSSAAYVFFDFQPPAPTVAGVSYQPAASNPLSSVRRATGGTSVRVQVSADEALGAAPPPSLRAHLGGAPDLVFQRVNAELDVNDALFEAVVPASQPDGEYALAVTWSDVLGNTGTAVVPGRTVLVKTSSPTLLVDQDALVFVRSPQGNSAEEYRGGHRIPPGPYFGIEPSDFDDPSDGLPAHAIELQGGEALSMVLVYAADNSGLFIGSLRPVGGVLPRQALVSPDVTGALLVGVDDAGNRTDPVKLQNADWVVTSGALAQLNSTHEAVVTPIASPGPVAVNAPVTADASSLAGLDGVAAVSRAAAVWSERTYHGSEPSPPRTAAALAFDRARGRVVMFGGYNVIYESLTDTWEFDGIGWTRKATEGPPGQRWPHMAYDPARGRVVMVAGGFDWEWDGSTWHPTPVRGDDPGWPLVAFDPVSNGLVAVTSRNTWLSDGTQWRLVDTSGPRFSQYGSALAFDGSRGRLVAVHELGFFEWDGSTWMQIGNVPEGAQMGLPSLAFDEARSSLVLTTGEGSGYLWNGTNWTVMPGLGRLGARLAYDSLRERVIAFGGEASNVTQEWDGHAWATVAKPGPTTSYWHSMAYDAARERIVLWSEDQETWEWNGTGWMLLPRLGVWPSVQSRATLVYDGNLPGLLLVGAVNEWTAGETWAWNGASWSLLPARETPPSGGYALSWDPARRRVVLHRDSNQDTWEWVGGDWSLMASGPGTPERHSWTPAMCFDGTHTRLDSGSNYTSSWVWDGSAWRSAGGGSSRDSARMAYDSGRRRALLYGSSFNQPLRDTLEWTGSAWTQLPTAGETPLGRFWHSMAFDEARGRLVVFGGASGAEGSNSVTDTWELLLSPAQRPAINFRVDLKASGVPTSAIIDAWVRAYAGGTSTSGTGAALFAWSSTGSSRPGMLGSGGWTELAANAAAMPGQAPQLVDASTARLGPWRASSAENARRIFTSRDARLALQVRPRGGIGQDTDGAAVALDYIELRVRYTAP